MSTKREATLARLLRQTWEALPFALDGQDADEVDWPALCALSDTVRAALGEPPLEFTQVSELPLPKEPK